MLDNHVSRRKMLKIIKSSAAVITCAAITPSLFTSCKKNDQAPEKVPENIPESCPEASNLSQEILARRKLLNYVDTTAIPTRTCSNCKLYTKPTTSHCGGCQVLPGPVHPKGYCSSWYYRM